MSEKSFCDVFKELRLEKDLSQDAIAKELDVSPALISKWENNQSTPGPEMLEYIADYFDVSIDYLVGRTNDKRYFKSTNEDLEIINSVYDELRSVSISSQKFIYDSILSLISSLKALEKEGKFMSDIEIKKGKNNERSDNNEK